MKNKSSHEKQKQMEADANGVRIDKWLWAARFYKTRRLATEAIQGGKIQLNGSKAKASKLVNEGSVVTISQGGLERTVIVKVISDKRGPAAVAQTLYEETIESLRLKEIYKEQMKSASNFIHTEGKPNKKDRRLIHRFKQKNQ
ncbi:MAG: S4 domain-containing protein [Gammaproteobacteria bacterium]|nr:S4 domain-containing protein [Gammaproteobacteria bacterium]